MHGVRSMLDLYGVGGERWAELIELTRQTRQKGWWRAYGLDDKGYVPLKTEATLVRDFTLIYVPGLLQTAGYARAMFRGSLNRYTEADVENYALARTIRAQRLTAETAPLELVNVTGAEWRKSSFSTGNGDGGCVEVAFLPGGGVAVRDTKDRTLAPHVYTPAEWDAFVAGVRAGEFDRPTP